MRRVLVPCGECVGGGGTTNTQTLSLIKMTTMFDIRDRLRFNYSFLGSNQTQLNHQISAFLFSEKRNKFILIYAHHAIYRHAHPVWNLNFTYRFYTVIKRLKALYCKDSAAVCLLE